MKNENESQCFLFVVYLSSTKEKIGDEMKISIKYILSILFVALITSSCGTSPTSKKEEPKLRKNKAPNSIVWDTLVVKNSQPLDVKDIKASCSIELHFITPIEFADADVLAKVQKVLVNFMLGDDNGVSEEALTETMTNYAANYVNSYKKEAKSQLALWTQVNGKGGYAYFSYDKKIETSVLYDEANLISYQVKTTELKGDETKTVSVKNLVIDLKTGTIVSEDDIFVDNELEKLNKILIAQIIKEKNVEDIEQLQELGYWGVADLEANNNFSVNKDGVTYTFSPAEYSDEKLGILNIFVDYDDLLEILKPTSPISILANDTSE